MTNQPQRTLIFPGGMPRSIEFLRRCQDHGVQVLGASSLPSDSAQRLYTDWVILPMVTDAQFDTELRELVTQHSITAIFTPNLVVWNYFREHLSAIAPEVKLINVSPVEEAVSGFRQAQLCASVQASSSVELAACTRSQARLSPTQFAAVYRHAGLIPGMCDDDKIHALCEVARFIPKGDLIEIGSWWGKSAFVLAILARQYRIGTLLCVDPWQLTHLQQKDANKMVDQLAAQLDAEEAFLIFQINLAPFAGGHVNYLRLPSVDAAAHYRQSQVIDSPAFGETHYSGDVALLHIDGNHSLEAVQADVDAWAHLVVPGGWIIFDDYVWPYGDGPKRTGDAFLSHHNNKISTAFVMGSALFVQLAEAAQI